EILSPEEIQGITGPLEGRELDVSQLMKAVKALDALYGSKGYLTAKALLPPQDVEGGVVYIQLVEGRLGQLFFSGNKHTADRYLQDRISLKPGDLIRLSTLEEDILYFNQTNDVTLHGELSPGEEFGTTDITVLVEEA
ncbi:MAG TPA: ShlB/FhaC/HecB family hemolysin secretion/activation protein, partial [Firmicutes bacterium]|nr:ShlB/FhaC/HecB family hemolysin secretion/activation protein [Bacillota bacterium]